MFDVDLMNRPGIQKIISKVNVNPNPKKQEIVFGNLESTGEQKNIDLGEDKNHKTQTSALSIIIASIILTIFLAFGFFRLNEDLKLSSSILKYASYFQSTKSSNLDIGKTLIINFLSNPEKTQFLKSINVNQNLEINIKIDEISDLNLKNKESKFLNIIEDETSYNASFYIPINHSMSDNNIHTILNDLINEYEDNKNVFLRADSKAIYFTSNGKIIYEILEKLIFTNNITITANASGHFKLKYPY